MAQLTLNWIAGIGTMLAVYWGLITIPELKRDRDYWKKRAIQFDNLASQFKMLYEEEKKARRRLESESHS